MGLFTHVAKMRVPSYKPKACISFGFWIFYSVLMRRKTHRMYRGHVTKPSTFLTSYSGIFFLYFFEVVYAMIKN